MESMRDIRGRMVSVQKTRKITNAMYLMASSKLKKARSRLDATGPYFEKLQYVIADILSHTPEACGRYMEGPNTPTPSRCAYLIVTSDNGLAGAYNQNVCRLAEQELAKTTGNTLYFSGMTGRRWFEKKPQLGSILPENCSPALDPEIWNSRRLGEQLLKAYDTGEIDCVRVVYTKMKNALQAEAEVLQLLPLSRRGFITDNKENTDSFSIDYEPSPEAVLDRVVPSIVKGLLYGCLVESYAAEQNARMSAMKSATDNADEIVRGLQLQYNRVRQAAITTELNEVVAGANAQGMND